MNCPNCGKIIDDGTSFCTSCGESVNSTEKPALEEKKKNSTNKKAILFTIGCVVVAFAIIAVVIIAIITFIFNVFKSVSETKEYDMGIANVPSVYALMGKEEICSFSSSVSNGDKEYEIDYCKASDKMLNEYIDTLKKDYGFREVEDTTFNREVMLPDKNGSTKTVHVIISGNVITYKVE